MNLSEKFCRGIMKLSFRRGISQKLEYTYNGEKAMYETVLEVGKGWQIIFRLNAQGYIALHFLCRSCHHRLTRQRRKARSQWKHFYAVNPLQQPWPHRVCYCGCDTPEPPTLKEQEKAYRRLVYWKRQFQLHRSAFFTGEIRRKLKRGN